MRLSWNFLWGFPGEDDAWYAEMAAWLPALEHLQPPSGMVRVRYDRFSPYHQRPETFGLALAAAPAASHVYPLPPAELADLAYYFADAGRPDVFTGAGGEVAAGRPGVRAMEAALLPWQMAFWRGELPLLTIADVADGAALAVEDTRSIAAERSYELSGLDRAVYLACEDAPAAARVASMVAAEEGRSPPPSTASSRAISCSPSTAACSRSASALRCRPSPSRRLSRRHHRRHQDHDRITSP